MTTTKKAKIRKAKIADILIECLLNGSRAVNVMGQETGHALKGNPHLTLNWIFKKISAYTHIHFLEGKKREKTIHPK